MAVIFRPTVSGDLPHLTDKPLPFRIKAWTALIDGRVIGVGGIGFMPDGAVVALAQMTDEMRAHRFALHRAAKRFLADVKASGIQELVTLADQDITGAENWLHHLGFVPVVRNGVRIWLWRTR
jgi:hypothetical protein